VRTYLDSFWFDGSTGFDVSFQVYVQELHYKIQFLVRMYDVQKPGNNPVMELVSGYRDRRYDWNDGRPDKVQPLCDKRVALGRTEQRGVHGRREG
jgi:hypothetical protein